MGPRLADEQLRTDRKQLAQHALVGFEAIAHFGFESNGFLHLHHGLGLDYHSFVGVQLNFQHLNVGAQDTVVYVVRDHENGGQGNCRQNSPKKQPAANNILAFLNLR